MLSDRLDPKQGSRSCTKLGEGGGGKPRKRIKVLNPLLKPALKAARG